MLWADYVFACVRYS